MCMRPFACIILWQCERTVIIKRDYLCLVSGFSPKVIIVQAAWSILTLYGQQQVLQLKLTLPEWQAKRMHYKKCTTQRQTHNIIQLSGALQIYNSTQISTCKMENFVVSWDAQLLQQMIIIFTSLVSNITTFIPITLLRHLGHIFQIVALLHL